MNGNVIGTGDIAGRISRVRHKVCYGDTDAAGVVYYSNYLRFMEAGRNGYLRDLGMSVRGFQEEGVLFPVVEVNLRYRSPAFLDDGLIVATRVEKMGPSSIVFRQEVFREAERELLVEGTVRVACVDGRMHPRRLPGSLRKRDVED